MNTFEKISAFFRGTEFQEVPVDPLEDFTVEPKGGDSPTKAQAASFILVSLAVADNDFSPEERDFVIHKLQVTYNLSDGEVAELMEGAKRHAAAGRGVLSYAEFVSSRLSRQEKEAIVEEVKTLVKADGKVEAVESFLETKLRVALGL